MNVTMTEEQFERILQMAVLGEYVVNAPAGAHPEYREALDALLRAAYLRDFAGETEPEENELAGVFEWAFGAAEPMLEAFEEDVRSHNS